jgi:hypothetical protein
MAIPEAQLETWSHPGQTGQFTSTYETIRNVRNHPKCAVGRERALRPSWS